MEENRCNYRPDYFHHNETTNMSLYGDFDEIIITHENNHNRLEAIAGQTVFCWKRTFYIRVVPYLDNNTLALTHIKDGANWQNFRTHTKCTRSNKSASHV